MFIDVKNTFILVCFWSVVRSEPPSTDYGTPLGAPILNYQGAGSHYSNQNGYNNQYNGGGGDHHNHDHGHDHGDGEPKSYEFGYQVKDDYTGTNYNRQESSDGNQVRGEYRVALPDGRTQIVTYWADWQSGFHADVKYEGEAQYPDQYNRGNGYPGNGYQGGYSNGVSNQYGAPGGNYNGFQGNSASSSAINNLAASHDNYNNNNYDSYNNGYNKPPSAVYGAV